MRRPLLVCCESHRDAEPYVEALIAAGIDPEAIRVLVPDDEPDEPGTLATGAAGLLLCGGPDVEPWRYGESRLSGVPLSPDPPLDELELRLIEGAHEGRTPVWAICRGMQTINVFFGGSLYQDLPTQVDDLHEHDVPEPRSTLAHYVEVTGSGEMSDLLAGEEIRVNTRHHQAVKELGRGLATVGKSTDGVLEAMQWDSEEWWMWAVQWHPENLIHLDLQRELWKRFAQVTR